MDEESRSPLHLAAANGDGPMVEWMLDSLSRGPPSHIMSPSRSTGKTERKEGEEKKEGEGKEGEETQEEEEKVARSIELLRRKGVRLLLCGRDSKGCMPLHLAAMSGSVETVASLARFGAPLDIVDGFGFTPLQYAVCEGKVPILVWLLLAGADSQIKTRSGKSLADLLPTRPKENLRSPPSFPFLLPPLSPDPFQRLLNNTEKPPPVPPPPIAESTARFCALVAVYITDPFAPYPPGVRYPEQWELQVARKRALASWQTVSGGVAPCHGALAFPSASAGGGEETERDQDVATARDQRREDVAWQCVRQSRDSSLIYVPSPVASAAAAVRTEGRGETGEGGGGEEQALRLGSSSLLLQPVYLLQLNDLAQDAKYTIRSRVGNRNGWSKWSDVVVFKTTEASGGGQVNVDQAWRSVVGSVKEGLGRRGKLILRQRGGGRAEGEEGESREGEVGGEGEGQSEGEEPSVGGKPGGASIEEQIQLVRRSGAQAIRCAVAGDVMRMTHNAVVATARQRVLQDVKGEAAHSSSPTSSPPQVQSLELSVRRE